MQDLPTSLPAPKGITVITSSMPLARVKKMFLYLLLLLCTQARTYLKPNPEHLQSQAEQQMHELLASTPVHLKNDYLDALKGLFALQSVAFFNHIDVSKITMLLLAKHGRKVPASLVISQLGLPSRCPLVWFLVEHHHTLLVTLEPQLADLGVDYGGCLPQSPTFPGLNFWQLLPEGLTSKAYAKVTRLLLTIDNLADLPSFPSELSFPPIADSYFYAIRILWWCKCRHPEWSRIGSVELNQLVREMEGATAPFWFGLVYDLIPRLDADAKLQDFDGHIILCFTQTLDLSHFDQPAFLEQIPHRFLQEQLRLEAGSERIDRLLRLKPFIWPQVLDRLKSETMGPNFPLQLVIEAVKSGNVVPIGDVNWKGLLLTVKSVDLILALTDIYSAEAIEEQLGSELRPIFRLYLGHDEVVNSAVAEEVRQLRVEYDLARLFNNY